MMKRAAAVNLASLHRFADTPLLLSPRHIPMAMDQIRRGALTGVDMFEDDGDSYGMPSADSETSRAPYEIFDGIAVIPIKGALMHSADWWTMNGTYQQIANKLIAASKDASIKAIALHICSPGGEVAGCFDLAEVIYGMRGSKPIWAILDEYAYSAAYALASAADRIIVPKTGGTGSIGVITMHMDITKMLDDCGVMVSTIQFGARKSDSYPTTPLSAGARERLQADVDELGEMFVDMVARNRGIAASAVKDTEAGCFMGKHGVEIGLADDVAAPADAFAAFMQSIGQ